VNYNQRFFIGTLKASSFEKVRATLSAILVYAKSVRKRKKKKKLFPSKSEQGETSSRILQLQIWKELKINFHGNKKISKCC